LPGFGDESRYAEAVLGEKNLMLAIRLKGGIVDAEVDVDHIRLLGGYPFLEMVESPKAMPAILYRPPHLVFRTLLHHQGLISHPDRVSDQHDFHSLSSFLHMTCASATASAVGSMRWLAF
jgi:hypothetical protein